MIGFSIASTSGCAALVEDLVIDSNAAVKVDLQLNVTSNLTHNLKTVVGRSEVEIQVDIGSPVSHKQEV